MATTNKATAKELATLALAKGLAEGDAKAVDAALKSGADADAFWIDGRKRLRDLAGTRGTASGAKAIKLLFAPEALKILPSKKSDPTLWQQSFVEFVAMRGYGFHGMTNPLSPGGTELKGITSAKSGVRLIHNSWSRGLLDANCKDSEDGKSSSWFILFDADWKQDRRVVGFWIRFEVDALGWVLLAEYKAAKESGTMWKSPPLTSPYMGAQKEWESQYVPYDFDHGSQDVYTVEKLIAYMRAGGSPFGSFADRLVGKKGDFQGTPETNAFMKAFRKAVGPKEGWHLRIESMLAEESMSAFLAIFQKGQIANSTPKAKAPKKPLKTRANNV